MNIQKALHWRYAAKSLDKTKKIPGDKLQILLDSVRFAPSGNNIQPWKVFIIEDQDLKEQIQKVSYDQPKVSQSSHLIVFTAKDDLDQSDVEALVRQTAKIQGSSEEKLKGFKDYLSGFIDNNTNEFLREWAKRQTYIQMGFLLMAAAIEEIDAGPMEGFINEELDKILKLDEIGYKSVAMVALGYRSQDDKYSEYPKVRFDEEDIFIWK